MKRVISGLGYILFALIVLLPLGTLLTSCLSYVFKLVSITFFAIVIALISVSLVVLSIIQNQSLESRTAKVLFALLAPLSIVNAVFYMLENSSILVIVCMLSCIGCSIFLTTKHGKPILLKTVTLTLSSLAILPMVYFSFIAFAFGSMGQNTVIKSVESPNKAYYAEIIDSDQGALGGATWVDVNKKGIDVYIFKISKEPQRVYSGEWGDFEGMELHWKNNACLVINSEEYIINLLR